MGTLLHFDASARKPARPVASGSVTGEVVIFPGVRIERHDLDLDLGHRLRDTIGHPELGGMSGGGRRPKRTS